MPARLHLGVNSCFAVKRWPEPARWTSLVVDELGLTDCQVTLDLFDPGLDRHATEAYGAAVAASAAHAGLSLHSTFTGLAAYSQNLLLHPDRTARRSAERWFERVIALTAAMEVPGTGGFLGAMSVADAQDAPRRRALLEDLRAAMERLATTAAGAGLSFLLFENMAVGREYGFSIDEARGLEDALEGAALPWTLCLDLGHPCALHTGTPSDDPLAWIGHGLDGWRHTPVLQIQQANRDGDHHWPFTPERNRTGSLSAPEVVDALAAGERGGERDVYLFLEVIHPPEYPDDLVVEELRQSVDYWRQALAGAGHRPA